MIKAINKAVCIAALILAIGCASDGHFGTAALLAAWPCFVGVMSLADDIRRCGI